MRPLNELHTSELITVKIEDLFLDPANPRIAVETEDLTSYSIEEIVSPRVQKSVLPRISATKNKIPEMVRTLKAEGFANGAGVFWVKEILSNKYIVLEGNRRVTAMKEIVDSKDDVSDAIISTFNRIQANKFIYTPNEDYTEEEVISILLAKIHISSPLGWGAMEKSRVLYDQYLKELKIYLSAEVNNENFTLVKKPMQNVTEMFDLQRGHAKKNIKTYQIYKQLKDNEYEIDTDRFTLIEMATGDATLSDYFEMQENVLFSNVGLERFYKLCVEHECPVSNPQSFRKLAYIIKHGQKTHLNLVISCVTPIETVHEQVVALKERGKVQSDLEEIKRNIMNLPLLGFTDSEAEWDLIQDISNLVETKLVPLISEEATTSNDDSMPTEVVQ